jgi:hypothetical protein
MEAADGEDTVLLADDTVTNQLRPTAATERPTSPDLTVDLIDMSDLEEAEETAPDLAETSAPRRGGSSEDREDPENSMAETLTLGETLEITRAEPQARPPGAPEVVSDLGADDLLDTELELRFEVPDEEQRAAGAESDLLIDLDNPEAPDDEQDNPPPRGRT